MSVETKRLMPREILEQRQAEMRDRPDRPRKSGTARPRRKRSRLAPAKQRYAALVEMLTLGGVEKWTLGDFRSLTQKRPFGRGWWARSVRELLALGVLRKTKDSRGQIFIRLGSKKGS